jgi:HNH endonuclease
VYVDDGLRVRTHTGREVSDSLPELTGLVDALATHRVILDGELVVCPDGVVDFYALAPRMMHTGRMARWAAESGPGHLPRLRPAAPRRPRPHRAAAGRAQAALVLHRCWSYHAGYATARVDGRTVLMHGVVLGLGPGHVPEVDHINHDPLGNRMSNLRVGTRNQNGWNRQKQRSPSSSRFKGVDRFHGRIWRARIRFDSKDMHIGLYEIEEEAARAYNIAATELFGEYAYLSEV